MCECTHKDSVTPPVCAYPYVATLFVVLHNHNHTQAPPGSPPDVWSQVPQVLLQLLLPRFNEFSFEHQELLRAVLHMTNQAVTSQRALQQEVADLRAAQAPGPASACRGGTAGLSGVCKGGGVVGD